MHAHRIEVLDRADDDHVVEPVADHLELELVPAEQRLLQQHLADRRLGDAARDVVAELVRRRREAAALAAERERRPDHDRQRQRRRRRPPRSASATEWMISERAQRRPCSAIARANSSRSSAVSMAWMEAPISSIPSSVQHAGAIELHRRVERGLAAQRRQDRVGPLAAQHGGDPLQVERLDVRPVGPARVGHDRGRVRVDRGPSRSPPGAAPAGPARRSSRTRRPGRSRSGRSRSRRSCGGRRGAASGAGSLRARRRSRRTAPARRARRAGRARPRGGTASTTRAGRRPAGPRRCRRRARRG